MRNNPTEPEKRLWRYLSGGQLEGFKFRRQQVIGHYIADFVCASAKLIIEVDGDTHDEASDRARDAALAGIGYRVVHVSNHDVMANMDGVFRFISKALLDVDRPHPNPVNSAGVNHASGMIDGLPGAIPAPPPFTPEGEGL